MSDFNGDELRRLIEGDPELRAFLEHTRRRSSRMHVTKKEQVENLLRATFPSISGGRVLRTLALCGCGSFNKGRLSTKTRLVWSVHSRQAADYALNPEGNKPEVDVVSPEDADVEEGQPCEVDSAVPGDNHTDRITNSRYTIEVRPGVSATILVPNDLTAREAKRLSNFVLHIPFEPEDL